MRTPTPLSPFEQHLEAFYERSMLGEYYRPVDRNSKNYRELPPATAEWITKMEGYLQGAVALVDAGDYSTGQRCLETLLSLVAEMEDDRVVSAKECGSWLLSPGVDYLRAFILASARTEDPYTFADSMSYYLRRDTYRSFADDVYGTIRELASPQQVAAVAAYLREAGIRTKPTR